MVLHKENFTSVDTHRVLIGITSTAMNDMNTMTELAEIPLLLGGIDITMIETILGPEETIVAGVAAGAGAVTGAVRLQRNGLQVEACQARKS
ncbi:hypothetical protein LTR84_007418 [Exophiala bonariae]|uniref:Uncharacterized protein n=1 Tax=Exophiala bonariae TaxID=1690606 RepID=A0AAV9MYU0_9EURO|nr:hypothetical protein LTR84_007418 [Exophiala bonariae]